MTSSLLQGKRFHCREWAFSKVNHCLDNRSTAKTCGALIMGGPGCGKTALCCEVVWPSSSHGKQLSLSKRVLAYYFCQAHDIETLSITSFIHCIVEQLSKSLMVPGYEEHLQHEDIQQLLDPVQCEKNPDLAFRKGVLEPLSMITPPAGNLFLLVDSIDESYLRSICEKVSGSKTIAELLSNNHQHFPQWLLLICSARKQSKLVTRMFTGFRKISLDDLRKSHVVRDVQQYILCRLDQEEELRQHLSRETAEMLNQLHIKSNGCFLYLEKVLDGVANNFVLLREIREIPGTLNGLYLWLCQRLFVRKQFAKVQPILNVILAARRPLTEMELYSCAYTRNTTLSFEEFKKRLNLLEKILIEGKDGTKILFHHSFAEWLLDVKHCTQKYLCAAADGHGMLAMSFTMHAPSLAPLEIQDFALHLVKSSLHETMDSDHLSLWMVQSGAEVEDSLCVGLPKEQAVLKLLLKAGAKPVSTDVMFTEVSPPGTILSATGTKDEPSIETATIADTTAAVIPPVDTIDSLEEVDSNGRTMLCSAAYQGNLTLVKQLLAKHVDLEAVDKSGQTALNLAARQGHSEVVGALLKEGAIVDHEDHDGWTALRSAAWGGHTEVVELLLDAGAEVDHADSDHRTALRAAAWGGHEEIVTKLLDHEAEVNKVDNEGRTALIAAAYMGHGEIVEHLLNQGADINHQDIDGRTALSVAALCIPASRGHSDVVSLLLDRGAEVDHQDKDGMTPLLVAAYEGHQNVCELLLECDGDVDHSDVNGRTALQAAASMGHSSVVNQLLFWGAAVDAIDSDGRTVLCIAAQQGSGDVVRQLLDRGLDEMHRDNAGWTPLHMASFEGHREVVDLLIESGARITEIDNDGRIPMLLAAQEGHMEVVASLLEHGSPIEARAHDGKTSLRVGALEGHKEVVRYLVQGGADVNYKDADGRSTLYVLSLENHVPMAAFLMENLADVEGCDLEGRTPLHVAAWQGHFDMAALLLTHVADVNAVDNDRRTALQSAAWQGHSNIVKLLLEKGAVVDHTCNQGATALCIAAQEGHEEVVQVLLQFHANPNHADQFGRTATRVALKGGHNKVVKLLEEFGAQPLNGVNGRRSGGGAIGSSGVNTNTKPIPNPAPHAHKQSCNANNHDKHRVAPVRNPSQALASAMAIANGHIHGHTKSPSESPASTFDTRKSLTNNSNKSSSNQTNSVHTNSTNQSSCSGGAAEANGSLTFTQQLQQCSMSKNRNRLSKVLSPVGEPHSPSQDSPAGSPMSEIQGGNTRLTPDMQSPSGVLSPRRADTRVDPVRIISNPTSAENSTSNIYESIDEPIWQRQSDYANFSSSLKTGGKSDVYRKPSRQDAGPNHVSPLVMGSAALSMKSPEMRRKRNGIVTNPNFSMTKNVSINGYFNKLADTVDNYPEGRTPNGNTPSASLPSKRPTRPSGLPLKKETPL